MHTHTHTYKVLSTHTLESSGQENAVEVRNRGYIKTFLAFSEQGQLNKLVQ